MISLNNHRYALVLKIEFFCYLDNLLESQLWQNHNYVPLNFLKIYEIEDKYIYFKNIYLIRF